jgi:aminoglycoside phosphotransferase (APT) family kinase protein
VNADDSERELIERLLGRPVSCVTPAAWGFTNRTDMVTFDDGEQVVVQRYRQREDAEYRLRVMRGLQGPAVRAGIPLPRVRDSNMDRASGMDDDVPWVVYDVLPGLPLPEAGELGPGGSRFPSMARIMGELLATFRQIPTDGFELDQLWADPERLAATAAGWARQLSIADAGPFVDAVPDLFAGRPAVLAHGDFAPVNILTDGERVTGLLDFEAVRLADPLFDPAWWAWSVSFASSKALDQAWPAFLDGAGLDAGEPDLAVRVRVLQVLRMLEQLATGNLAPGIAHVVMDRLHEELAR